MYQFSRAMYRQLAPAILEGSTSERTAANHETVLRACETAIRRLANDPEHYRHPARSLFRDVRPFLQVCALLNARGVIEQCLAAATEWLELERLRKHRLNGGAWACRALTRQGTACQREAVAPNGYCPSHQHLAETEECELVAV
jgi:hypothetical protein